MAAPALPAARPLAYRGVPRRRARGRRRAARLGATPSRRARLGASLRLVVASPTRSDSETRLGVTREFATCPAGPARPGGHRHGVSIYARTSAAALPILSSVASSGSHGESRPMIWTADGPAMMHKTYAPLVSHAPGHDSNDGLATVNNQQQTPPAIHLPMYSCVLSVCVRLSMSVLLFSSTSVGMHRDGRTCTCALAGVSAHVPTCL